MKAKPISFNTDAVRALLAGRKTVTRRVVKPQPDNPRFNCVVNPLDVGWYDFVPDAMPKKIRCPYKLGDILYVKETWNSIRFGNGKTVPFHTVYWYKADDKSQNPDDKWRPSIHMPREAARIFLRVTDVRVERLQDIDDDGVVAEGLEIGDPFDELWDSTLKPAGRALYGWNANPWVWVIEFERIGKEEAEKSHAKST